MRHNPFKSSVECVMTHIHYVVEDNESSPSRLLFVADADLADAAITPKQIVQILSCDLIVEVLDK